MDPNNPNPQNPTPNPAPAAAPTPAPAFEAVQGAPVTTPAQPQAETALPASQGGKNMMILIIVFLVVAILIGVGFYLYTQASKTDPGLTQAPSTQESTLNNLDQEASSLDVGDVESDFKDVDSQLDQI